MKKVVLYIAASLDGYIADVNGNVEWLGGDGSQPENPGSYDRFIKTVDTVIFGNTTYQQIVTELSPYCWLYEGKTCYVLSHNEHEPCKEVTFTSEPIAELIARLKAEEGLDIWVCGGASVIQQLFTLDLIDKLCVSIIPTLLGDGVRLFGELDKELPLRLISTEVNNGMTDLWYERR